MAVNGGGVYAYVSSNPEFTGCTFSGNHAQGTGGAVDCGDDSSPTLMSCTLYGNSADGGTAGIYSWGGSSNPNVANTIIAFSTAGPACGTTADMTFTCCDIYGNAGGDSLCGTDNGGNFSADPLFCDRWNGDFHLALESPCLNAPGCGLVGGLGEACGGMQFSSIGDVPDDQGRYVRVRWDRALHDAPATEYQVTSYTLWRRIDQTLLKDGDVQIGEIASGVILSQFF